MTSSLVIRRMKRTDAKALARMMQKLASFRGDKIRVNPSLFATYGCGHSAPSRVLIALKSQMPVAFVVSYLFVNYKRGTLQYQIDYLFVEEACRGAGIGLELLRATARDALSLGCARLCVNAEATNKKANAFYKRAGLTSRQLRHKGYLADARMIKTLARA